jgi:hypothetical protein
MVKFSTAAVDDPLFVTVALDPAVPVVVDPTATETTVAPVAPCGPAALSSSVGSTRSMVTALSPSSIVSV